jgi:hypothetical protein
MKVNKQVLSEIIDEEINLMIENGELDEGFLDRIKAYASGAGERAKGFGRGALQKGLAGVMSAADDEEMADRYREKAQGNKAATAGKVATRQAKSLIAKRAKQLRRISLDFEGDAIELGAGDILKQELGALQDLAQDLLDKAESL